MVLKPHRVEQLIGKLGWEMEDDDKSPAKAGEAAAELTHAELKTNVRALIKKHGPPCMHGEMRGHPQRAIAVKEAEESCRQHGRLEQPASARIAANSSISTGVVDAYAEGGTSQTEAVAADVAATAAVAAAVAPAVASASSSSTTTPATSEREMKKHIEETVKNFEAPAGLWGHTVKEEVREWKAATLALALGEIEVAGYMERMQIPIPLDESSNEEIEDQEPPKSKEATSSVSPRMIGSKEKRHEVKAALVFLPEQGAQKTRCPSRQVELKYSQDVAVQADFTEEQENEEGSQQKEDVRENKSRNKKVRVRAPRMGYGSNRTPKNWLRGEGARAEDSLGNNTGVGVRPSQR